MSNVLPVPHISPITPPLRPILATRPDYSQLPLSAGFGWADAFGEVADGDWYLVAFRSRHRPDADVAHLTWLDEQASAAASRNAGFLYYFIGTPLPNGDCLSFCLWESQAAAVTAAADPEHRAAMILGLPNFLYYTLERYQITKRAGTLAMAPIAGPPRQEGHWRQPPLPSHPGIRAGAGGMTTAGAAS